MLPLFSALSPIKIERKGNVFKVYDDRGKRAPINEPSPALMAIAFALRSALQFASAHHIAIRGVRNLDDKFIAYVLYPTVGVSAEGVFDYLRRVGFQKDVPYDFREGFVSAVENVLYVGSEARKWKWRTLRHKSSRL